MMTRARIAFIVFAVLVLAVGFSFLGEGIPNTDALPYVGVITTIIYGGFFLFNHWGWRVPWLGWVGSSPNVRGTWEFKQPDVVRLTEPPEVVRDLTSGYLTVEQSDSHIKVEVLWQGNGPSVQTIPSPVSINKDKCAFSGTYLERPEDDVHAFGAFFTFTSKRPLTFVMRYRTDHGLTGEIRAEHRKPWIANDAASASEKAKKSSTLVERLVFALWWM